MDFTIVFMQFTIGFVDLNIFFLDFDTIIESFQQFGLFWRSFFLQFWRFCQFWYRIFSNSDLVFSSYVIQ